MLKERIGKALKPYKYCRVYFFA